MAIRLIPIDLHDPAQFSELLRQRIVCGWNNEPQVLEQWRTLVDEGRKTLFWIMEKEEESPQAASGHIGLQSFDFLDDQQVARADKSILCISTLFVDPARRQAGLGRAAVQAVEAMACRAPYGSPDCHTLTIVTTSRRYTEEEGPEWRGSYAKRGLAAPPSRGSSNEDWYARMGYVPWKEEPRFENPQPDGSIFVAVAVFMRKPVGDAVGK